MSMNSKCLKRGSCRVLTSTLKICAMINWSPNTLQVLMSKPKLPQHDTISLHIKMETWQRNGEGRFSHDGGGGVESGSISIL